MFCHPFIAGELTCGTLRNRHEVLSLLRALPQARVLEHEEVLHFLDGRHLYGRGLGWVDVHLLTSALLTRCTLWILDKPLRRAAATLKILGGNCEGCENGVVKKDWESFLGDKGVGMS